MNFLRLLITKKRALAGLIWILLLSAVALGARFFATHDPQTIDISSILEAPSLQHWLGTDSLGRDLYSRMIFGARISLWVGLVAVFISVVVGLFLGSISGYFGKAWDRWIMGFVDVMLCFPTFFLILAVIAILEPSLFHIMVVIGLTSWMGTARLVRAEVLSLKEREFILAARSLGASNFRVITRHLIPNAMAPVWVNATLGVASAILIESALSFLGIGVQPPTPSWGNLLTEGKSTLGVAWWITIFPGLAILFTVLSFNLLAEGLSEIWDPRRENS